MAYLTEASKAALKAAVEQVESGSSAELVIAVRAQSGSLLVADLLAGVLGALGTLAFLLFSPFPFSLPAILFDTFLFGLLSGFTCSKLPNVRHVLMPRGLTAENVRVAARAEFFDGGISETSGRTGILVYVSQTERVAEVLADCGVRAAIDTEVWREWKQSVERVVRMERDGLKLAAAITAIAPPLAKCLPRAHDDVNELDDGVRG